MRGAVVEQLGVLRERVERWRKHRHGARDRIPEELWSAAVDVARIEGVSATCQALRFDYYKLKERVTLAECKGNDPPREKSGDPAFIELAGSPLGGGNKTVVELVGHRGGRMRIHVEGTTTVDVVGLVRAFWGHES